MNIDLLPFSSFALESAAGRAGGLGGGLTLTLDAAQPEHPLLGSGMRGTLSMAGAGEAAVGLCACVVPVQTGALTLTF